MLNVEYYPDINVNKSDLQKYTKIPISEITALGVAFASLPKFSRTSMQTIYTQVSGLYRAFTKEGVSGILQQAKDGIGTWGNIVNSQNTIVARTKFIEVSSVPTNITTTIPYNPTMLFMAAALANIDKKLDNIQETQQEILSFLVQKEKSELKGNINFLADILNNYKYNWNNDKYKNSNHIKVLDIKQTSETKIDFYREQIILKIDKQSFFHSDQEVNNQLTEIQEKFKDYNLALYLYAFSSFLEVMLLENFDSGYLDSIIHKIEDYSFLYQELYAKCRNQLNEYSKSSVQSQFLNGLANINQFVGNALTKVPIISNTQLDKGLIGASRDLKKMDSTKNEQILEQFVNNQSDYIEPFIENLKTVNRLYNQPMELLFDEENIYLCS